MALALLFLGRLVYLQVIMAPTFSADARESRTVGFPVEPRRGTIYDRNGNILAISVEATTIYANPSEVKEPNATARSIAEVLGGTEKDYIDQLTKSESPTFSFIQRKGDKTRAEMLKEKKLPGIYFLKDTRREYPYGQTGGQVVGACSIEVDQEANREYYVGICGLESQYNQTLSGTVGYYEAEVGRDGTPIPGGVHVSKEAVEGQDIVISLDIDYQELLEGDLKRGVAAVGVKEGTAMVMDAETGEILAAASTPFFNPADRSKVEPGSMQLKAATDLFEPGSIFKTVSCMSIFENEVMDTEDFVWCPPFIVANGYEVSDAFDHDYESMSLRYIMEKSSNIGISLAVEQHLGFDKFYNSILQYRFDKLTGVDYPGEQLGYLLGFDYWSKVQGYNATFGQGLSVNAMQMSAFYGALINDGIYSTPHFLLRKPQTNEVPEWPTYKIISNQKALKKMRDVLQSVVEEGTGQPAAIDGFDVAGKTSTAEIYDESTGGYRENEYVIAFAGFINNSNSKLVAFCSADEAPLKTKVTPMFRDIMVDAISRYNIVAN